MVRKEFNYRGFRVLTTEGRARMFEGNLYEIFNRKIGPEYCTRDVRYSLYCANGGKPIGKKKRYVFALIAPSSADDLNLIADVLEAQIGFVEDESTAGFSNEELARRINHDLAYR